MFDSLKRLPPVRRAVPIGSANAGSESGLPEQLGGYDVLLCRSGSDSLAAALLAAKARLRSTRPEALLPAYGCPDLVAACLAAGVQPRLVDTSRAEWGFDLAALDSAINPDTIAIVAVNLLGLGDQSELLLDRAVRHSLALIQDSAQHLPSKFQARWRGDFVVLSFGRGKPLNLLRGGALLIRQDCAPAARRALGALSKCASDGPMTSPAAALAFNTLTHPWVYGLVSRVPGLGLGESRFSALDEVHLADHKLDQHLATAYPNYAGAESYSAARWDGFITELSAAGVRPLTSYGSAIKGDQLLRLPLLAKDRNQRDALLKNLKSVGASPMYGVALNRIAQVPASVAMQGPFLHADDFAARLITLPTHRFVDHRIIERSRAALIRSAKLKNSLG